MFRTAAATLALWALSAFSAFSPPPALRAPRPAPEVDAVTFAVAFRDGNADQFRNKPISGTGTSFHGAIAERLADGSTRTSLVVTLGAVDRVGKLTPINAWDDFVAADREHTTLVVALSGPNLPAPPTSGPASYQFSGVYDGQVRTVPRVPQATGQDAAAPDPNPDSGPCAGERPRGDMQSGRFYCAPLLTGATATIRR